MQNSSIIQIATFVVSIAIILTYVRPTYANMSALKTQLAQYEDTLNKVNEYNTQLAQLTAQMQSYPQSEQDALNAFLPYSIDDLSVMSTIQAIVSKSNMSVVTLSSTASAGDGSNSGVVQPSGAPAPADTSLSSEDFNLSVTGSYDDMKTLLTNLEHNSFPLVVVSLKFGATSNGNTTATPASDVQTSGSTALPTYTLTLRTYKYLSTATASSTTSSDSNQ